MKHTGKVLPPNARKFAPHKQVGLQKMTKKEIWDNYWALNAIKVKLLLLLLKHPMNKGDREQLRRIEEAWGT